MTYRWVDHTAEVELAIEAESEREVFEDALHALADLLGVQAADTPGPPTATTAREVRAEAPDPPALLAAWLEELVFLAESEGFVATEARSLDLTSPGAVRATVAGVLDDPPPLVKAVTYHRLSFEPSGRRAGSAFQARVVLDV